MSTYLEEGSITPNELRRLFPNSSRSFAAINAPLPDTEPQPDKTPALGRPIQGEESSLERIVLRVTGYRVRCLDPDNFAASVKDICDGLIASHLLPNDTIWDIRLETEQYRVGTFPEEKTIVEIFYPKKRPAPKES